MVFCQVIAQVNKAPSEVFSFDKTLPRLVNRGKSLLVSFQTLLGPQEIDNVGDQISHIELLQLFE